MVNGPHGRSGGVVGSSFAPRPHSYDHPRSHKYKLETGAASPVKLPIWDFVVHRADGTAIRLHPEWNKPRFPSFAAEGHGDEVKPPRAGLGCSDGRGTYKGYQNPCQPRDPAFRVLALIRSCGLLPQLRTVAAIAGCCRSCGCLVFCSQIFRSCGIGQRGQKCMRALWITSCP